MAPKLGFFEQFKGADTVLLSVTVQEVTDLANRLQAFAGSSQRLLEIEAVPIPGHSTRLEAVREADVSETSAGFRWLCGPAQIAAVAGKLDALGNVASGHQYFELHGSRVQLLISIGEYAY